MIKSLTIKIDGGRITALKRMALDRGVTMRELLGKVIEQLVTPRAGPRDPLKYEGRDLVAPEEDYVAPPKHQTVTVPVCTAMSPDAEADRRFGQPHHGHDETPTPVALVCPDCEVESPLGSHVCVCGVTFAIHDDSRVRMSDGSFDLRDNWEGV